MNKKNINLLFLIGFSFIFSTKLVAQINNENLLINSPFKKNELKKIQFSANVLFFVHNREYFTEMADGYTLMGYWVNPKVAYQPTEKVLIEAGAYTRKEIGKSGLKTIEPTFTIKIKNNHWNYLLGNLEGNLSHKLVEPLMNFERILTKPLEHGLQAKYTKNANFVDMWLDYQQSTIAGKSNQEIFFSGFSSIFEIAKTKNISLKNISQTTIFHEGGQNLINNPKPARMVINPTLGLSLSTLNKKSLLMNFQTYYVGYFEGVKNGGAFYTNISTQKNSYQAILSYWNSTNFNSPFGGDLYQSQSRKFGNENYYEKHRELLFLHLIKDFNVIDGMNISVRVEPYYDIKNKLLEHAEGIYLKYGL